MSNINRQAAGTKQAGKSVGGQFAASQQTEASGFALLAPEPEEELTAQAQIAQRALEPDLSEYLRAHDDEDGSPVYLTSRDGFTDNYVEVGDILDSDLLADEEVDEGVRARGENFLHEQRLRHITRLGRSLDPSMEPLREREIAQLGTLVDAFGRESRWAEGNLLMVRQKAQVRREDVAGGMYRLHVERENLDHHHGDNEPTVITQQLTCSLEGIKPDTAHHYRLEIEDFLRKEYGARAEVVVSPNSMQMSVTKRSNFAGAATEDRIDAELSGDQGSSRLHDGAIRDAPYSAGALMNYLDGHERIPAVHIAHARDAWEGIADPGVHARAREASDEKMSAADWAVAMQAVNINVADGTRYKHLRDFTNRGRISSRSLLTAELAQAAEEYRDDHQFVDVAQQLRARLHEGPLLDRPDPELD
ncbi:hypothetical protein ACXR2T_09960 [Leucobacter sp. HY1910]